MITEQQREMRRHYIGSSDAAAILGVDPYKSAADVFLEKTGRVEPFKGNEDTDRGTFLEPAILSWAEKRLGVELERDVMLVHPNGILAANLDARAKNFTVEAKSSIVSEEWGEPGTDQVPERYLIQTHQQFVVAGPEYRVAYIPVLIADYRAFDFRMYRVERNDDLANIVQEQCEDFHSRYIKTNTLPSDYRPSLDVLKRMKRQPSKIVPLSDDLVRNYQIANDLVKVAEKKAEAFKTTLLAALGDAEGGTSSIAEVTYLEQNRAGFTVKPTTFRVLKIKKAK